MDASQSETTSQPTTNESKQPKPLTPPSNPQKHDSNNNPNENQIETDSPKPILNDTTNTTITETQTIKTDTNEDIDIDINKCKIQSINQNSNKIETKNSNELATSSNIPPIPIIPSEAKQFTFGCQIMIINLNSHKELNKKLGFVIGDYKPYSKRIPIRLITDQTDSSNSPTYLLKLNNLQFVSNPIPGYDVKPYNTSDNDSSDSNSDNDNDNDSDSDSSSSESSLSDTLANIGSINMNIKPVLIDEDDDIKQNNNNNKNNNQNETQFKISDEKLEKINENMTKYNDIIEQFNKPATIDLSPSITSTKSLPIDCGLRWEPKPVTESIENMQIEKIGTIKNIINDIEIVIESIHSPQSVITFDSVLCLNDHTAIGRVDDIFGAVKKPYYFVRLTVDKATQLKDKITLNQYIYAVKPLSHFVIPPQTDERYSSQSECSDQSSDDEQYRPKYINKRKQRGMSVDRQISNKNNKNRKNNTYKRKYYNNNNNYNNKRQRYSHPGANINTQPNVQPQFQNQFAQQMHAQQMQAQMQYQPYYYPSFNALPTAIPPPQSNTMSAATTATYFRPQVNIIPSPPTQYNEYMNNVNRYGLGNSPQQSQHQSPSGSVSSMQQHVSPSQGQTQQNTQASFPNATISINPFSFTKKK